MKLQTILFALLAFSVPQMSAIEPDQCAELAQQLREEQAKNKQLTKENVEKYFLENNEQWHNSEMTRAFKVATVASAISGAGIAVAKTFAPHVHHACPKAITVLLGTYVGLVSGVFSLFGVPDLLSNSLDSRRPAVERFGSLCAALVGIAPAAVGIYYLGSALPACS